MHTDEIITSSRNDGNTLLPTALSEVPPCPECGGLRGGHGNRRCPLMTLEYAQQEIINVEQRWIRLNGKIGSNWQKDKNKLKKQISFYQGKVAVLKHENNTLRKKLFPKGSK